MALVDYSSDDDDSSEDSTSKEATDTQPAKRRKTTHRASPATASDLPPLPAEFYDLYASTVRLSTHDDPALHQGRKRQNPHIVGHWPTHLYIEWHPTAPQYTLLSDLLGELESRLDSRSGPISISNFLSSDLDTPQPLHISLSRPLSLSTAQKDPFLSRLKSSIASSRIAPFDLQPYALEWHRTCESERSFLVLRVAPVKDKAGPRLDAQGGQEAKGEPATETESVSERKNAELSALLRRCNETAVSVEQPPLYAFADNDDAKIDVGDAFHVSIAWSFAEPTVELRRLTEEVFSSTQFRDGARRIRIRVDGIKAKIGNVVTHIPLPEPRSGLF